AAWRSAPGGSAPAGGTATAGGTALAGGGPSAAAAPDGPTVAVVSGGNIAPAALADLLRAPSGA
ncbi:MAG: hypothetical protein OXH04_22065, partial [Acidobacteria bacterium]|nr:hypothetical protein [Acidobacteriota bacterium]